MDPLKPAIGHSIPPASAPVRGASPRVSAPETPLHAPDKVDGRAASGRDGRVANALVKFELSSVQMAKTVTSLWSGEVAGSALGFLLIGGIYGPLFGGLAGAIGTLLLDQPFVQNRLHKILKPIEHAAGGAARAVARHTITPLKQEVSKAMAAVKGAIGNALHHAHAADARQAAQEVRTLPYDGSGVPGGSLAKMADRALARSGQPSDARTRTDATAAPSTPPSTGRGKAGSFFSKVAIGLASVGRSIPKFLYPSIQNATATEKKLILDTLDTLPLKSVTTTGSITINPALETKLNASGLARQLFFDTPVDLGRESMTYAGDNFNKGTIIHELGHTVDFHSGAPFVGHSGLPGGPFGKGPHIFDKSIDDVGGKPYAATNHFEDWAQTHKYYYLDPEYLKKSTPAKYADMQKFKQPTLYDKIMDHKPIREFGKKAAELIDKVPGLRVALSVAGTVAGPLTIHHGASEVQQGLLTGDPRKQFEGQMDLAKGVLFSSKTLAPASLGVSGLEMYLNRQIKHHHMTLQQANRIASQTLAASAGPAGVTAYVAANSLLSPGSRDKALAAFETPAGRLPRNLKPSEGEARFVKQTGAGMVAGGMAGGALAALTGAAEGVGMVATRVAFGAMLGIPVGGALVAGIAALKELHSGDPHDVRLADHLKGSALTRDDKVYIAKVAGGAVAGGAAGTVAGYAGGAIAGGIVGGLVGGPVGAAAGAWIGRTLGSMGLSYLGAKAGAKIGKHFDHGDPGSVQRGGTKIS